jgi:hypothetical protein
MTKPSRADLARFARDRRALKRSAKLYADGIFEEARAL